MAGSIIAVHHNGSSGRARAPAVSTGKLARGLGWFSICLGAVELLAPGAVTRRLGMRGTEELVRVYGVREIGTGVGILTSRNPAPWIWGRVGGDALDIVTVAAGLASRDTRKGNIALALAALAGVTALDVICGERLDRETSGDGDGGGGRAGVAEAERSITIGGKAADELYRLWRDPKTLPQIMAHAATVHATGDGRTHWQFDGPLGQSLEWDAETVDDRPGQGIGWRSLPGARVPNEGAIRFHPATGDRGTVATLRLRFDSPGGALGAATAKLLGSTPLGLAADQALHRFKSLVETGEIPTTERQPAFRADTR